MKNYWLLICAVFLLPLCVPAAVIETGNYSLESLGNAALWQKRAIKDQKALIAKFAIAALMGRPASTVKVSNKGDTYLVSYIRGNDGQHFSYKIRFAGNEIQWGNADGRWRMQSTDEKLSYTVKNNVLSIQINYSDGSKDAQTFKL